MIEDATKKKKSSEVIEVDNYINALKEQQVTTQNFDIDINDMRMNQYKKSRNVSELLGWFLFTLQFYGVNLDYASIKELIETFIIQIKFIIESD